MVKVKICGLTDPCEADYVNEAGADYAGMVLFVPKSKRNISIARAKEILSRLDPRIASVAVTVCPQEEQIRAVEEAGFTYLQVHGTISRELLDTIRIPVLKAFNVSDLSEYEFYHSHPKVAGYVFDAQTPGSGRLFDWSVLEALPRDDKPALLAGGLTPENVEEAIRRTRIYGVDTSSGVERTDGRGKSRERILAFAKAARLAGGTEESM